MFPVTIIIILRGSLSLFRFEKPPAPSRLDRMTTSEDSFCGALPPIGSLCVHPCPFVIRLFGRLCSESANDQFCLKHSFLDKTAKPVEHSFTLSPGEENVLPSNQQFLPSNQQFLPTNLSGFSHSPPPSSRSPPQPSTASRLSVLLRFRLPGTLGMFWFVRALRPGVP